MMVEWAAFEYREFYDYPRVLIIERDGVRYLLDCPFDEGADDYPTQYQIHHIENEPVPVGSWTGLGGNYVSLGSLALSPQLFDSTRRERIRWDLVRKAIEGRSQ